MRIFLIILLFTPLNLSASHIVGGEMFYDCLGGDEYRITLKLYRDCFSDGAEYDALANLSVFNGDDVRLNNFTISFPGSTRLGVNFNNNPCVAIPSNICIEEAIYTKVITLTGSTNGYKISYQRCCRGPNVTNLVSPENQGLTMTVTIPAASQVVCNSSPRFINYPPLLLCANQQLVFDHKATDPDGDDIVYELCTPFHGGGNSTVFGGACLSCPAPNPAANPPYNLIPWASGTSETNPFGMGSVSINPSTGELLASPQTLGLYVVGICAKEYRNGTLISTTVRDFLFRVLNCEVNLTAEIIPQSELSTFVSYCQGLTIDFENKSVGGDTWTWDFGVNGITTDVSTDFSPAYTYPAAGTYTVRLVVAKTAGCSDTTEKVFILNENLTADFSPPSSQCITGNSFDFTGKGDLPAGSSFVWNFGSSAIPTTSTNQNPTGIVFSKSGFIPITYSTSFQICNESITKEIFIFKEPTIAFSIRDELKCAPYSARFVNQSIADSPIFSDWTFGDGSPHSTDKHPTHIYQTDGIYDVSLTINTKTGCIRTLTLNRPNLVQVFPSPKSVFSVAPLVQDEFDANFTFTDLTESDVVKQSFHFTTGAFTPFSPFTYKYPNPGVYYPFQVVENQYGCRDTSQQKITIIPVVEILVPNAFTPDGDGRNETFKPVLYKEREYEMIIYNRWGELIYYSNSTFGEWDGNYKGLPVPDGVYVWTIVYNDFKHNIPKKIEGHVVLLR